MREAARRTWRGVAGVLSLACVISLTMLSGGAALADPGDPPPDPSGSTSDTSGSSGQSSGTTDGTSGPSGTSDSSGTGDDSTDTNPSATRTTNPRLVLWPNSGDRGRTFTATATGFGTCTSIAFQWGDEPSTRMPAVLGWAEALITVPEDGDEGDHTVTASCVPDGPAAHQEFDVVVPKTPPSLVLDPSNGGSGTPVSATAEHFACDTVSFEWDDTTQLGSAPTRSFVLIKHFPLTYSL